jgi:hypothetical protein
MVITRPDREVVQAARSGQPAHQDAKRSSPPPGLDRSVDQRVGGAEIMTGE